jgi:hypothetical protein
MILSFAVYQMIKILYTTFYFYFFPLLTMLMCNLIGDGKIYVEWFEVLCYNLKHFL